MAHNGASHRTRHSPHDLKSYHIASVLPFINPTFALFTPAAHAAFAEGSGAAVTPAGEKSKSWIPAVSYKWTSRNNRKGRHAITINPNHIPLEAQKLAPHPTSSLRKVAAGILRMFTVFPVWDISYDVAAVFTLGSVIWVFNAFFVWLPLVSPDTEFKNEILYGGGITAFIGATVFEVGSFLLMAEAVNENRTSCFGWALERAFSHESQEVEKAFSGFRLLPSEDACTHHHINRRNLVGSGNNTDTTSVPGSKLSPTSQSWIWFPTMEELRTHYLRELGFLACLSQLIGATIFWISGFTALPGIYDHLSNTALIVAFWTPQVVGGSGFIISGTLFMLETQSRWYKPAFKTLGWWIGAWNLIGGIGFTMCPAFGYDTDSWAVYQSSLATFWGSWAFLIGSTIQWYESLEKYPVEIDTASLSSASDTGEESEDKSRQDVGNGDDGLV